MGQIGLLKAKEVVKRQRRKIVRCYYLLSLYVTHRHYRERRLFLIYIIYDLDCAHTVAPTTAATGRRDGRLVGTTDVGATISSSLYTVSQKNCVSVIF